MSTGTLTRTDRELAAEEATKLLDQIMARQPSAVSNVITKAFEAEYIARIKDVLPDTLKDQAERFVKRAAIYFQKKDTEPNSRTAGCTVVSKVRCVIEAAEMGLALDGKLCHAVPYGKEVQCQPDYKGLIVVAKRTGEIEDAYGDVVCEGDHFEHGRKAGLSILEHTYDIGAQRGKVIGAYVVIVLPGGRWRAEVMQLDDLERIRGCSKQANGPAWSKHTNEMYKKTVLRRGLKLYCSDPGTLRAIELDEQEFGTTEITIDPADYKRVRRSALNDAPPAPGRSDPASSQSAGRDPSSDESTGSPADETPEPGAATEGREPGDDGPIDDPEPGEDIPPGGDDRPLSEAALALEAKLHDPAITRAANAAILQEILASNLIPAEKEHLKGIAKANTDRLKGKK